MASYLITVEYVDEDGDETTGEAVIGAENEAAAQDQIMEELEDHFFDIDPDRTEEARILRVMER